MIFLTNKIESMKMAEKISALFLLLLNFPAKKVLIFIDWFLAKRHREDETEILRAMQIPVMNRIWSSPQDELWNDP